MGGESASKSAGGKRDGGGGRGWQRGPPAAAVSGRWRGDGSGREGLVAARFERGRERKPGEREGVGSGGEGLAVARVGSIGGREGVQERTRGERGSWRWGDKFWG